MFSSRKTKKQKSKKGLLVPVVIVVLVLGLGSYWYLHRSKTNNKTTASTSISDDKDKINYAPPTDQDKAEVNQHKEDIPANQDDSVKTDSNTGKRSVSSVISSVYVAGDSVQAMGFVDSVTENGGTCIYTFTKGSQKVTKNTAAQADATTTKCDTLVFPKSTLSKGSWTVVMSYSSGKTVGSSNTWTLEVE